MPLDVGDDSTSLGTAASAGRLTVLAWPGASTSTFTVHDEDGQTTTLTAVRDASSTTVTVSRAPGGLVLRVWTESRVVRSVGALPLQASRTDFDAAESGWLKDGSYTWVRLGPSAGPLEVRLAH